MTEYREFYFGKGKNQKGEDISGLVVAVATQAEEFKTANPYFRIGPCYEEVEGVPSTNWVLSGDAHGLKAAMPLSPDEFEECPENQIVTASFIVPTMQVVHNTNLNFKNSQAIQLNSDIIRTTTNVGNSSVGIIKAKKKKAETNEDEDVYIPALLTQYPYADLNGESAIIVAQEKATLGSLIKSESNTEYQTGVINYTPDEPAVRCLLGSTIYSEGQTVLPKMQEVKLGWQNAGLQAIWNISSEGTSKYGGNDFKPFIAAAADFTIHPLSPTAVVEDGKIVRFEKADSNLVWNTNFRVNTNTIINLPQGPGPDEEQAAFRVQALSKYDIGRFCEGKPNASNALGDIFAITPSIYADGFFDIVSSGLSWLKKGVKVANTLVETAPAVLETIQQTFATENGEDAEEHAGIGLNGDLKIDAPVITVKDSEGKNTTKTLWPHISGKIGQQILEVPELPPENGILDWLGGVIKSIIPLVAENGEVTYGPGPEVFSVKYTPADKKWKHTCDMDAFFSKNLIANNFDSIISNAVVKMVEEKPTIKHIGKCALDCADYEINLRHPKSAYSPCSPYDPTSINPNITINCIDVDTVTKVPLLSLRPVDVDDIKANLWVSDKIIVGFNGKTALNGECNVAGPTTFLTLPTYVKETYPDEYPDRAFITKEKADEFYFAKSGTISGYAELNALYDQTFTGTGNITFATGKPIFFNGPVMFDPAQPTSGGSTEIMFNRHPVYSATGSAIQDPIAVNYITRAFADREYAKLTYDDDTQPQIFSGKGKIEFGNVMGTPKPVSFNKHPIFEGNAGQQTVEANTYITRAFADNEYYSKSSGVTGFAALKTDDNQEFTGHGEISFGQEKTVKIKGLTNFTGGPIRFEHYPEYNHYDNPEEVEAYHFITRAFADSEYVPKTDLSNYAMLNTESNQLFQGIGTISFGDKKGIYFYGSTNFYPEDGRFVRFNKYPIYNGKDDETVNEDNFITKAVGNTLYLKLDDNKAIQRLTGYGIEFGEPEKTPYPVNFNDIPYYVGEEKTLNQIGINGFVTKAHLIEYAAPSELIYDDGGKDRKIGNMKPLFIKGADSADGSPYEELQFPMYMGDPLNTNGYKLGFRVKIKGTSPNMQYYPSLVCIYKDNDGNIKTATIWSGETN